MPPTRSAVESTRAEKAISGMRLVVGIRLEQPAGLEAVEPGQADVHEHEARMERRGSAQPLRHRSPPPRRDSRSAGESGCTRAACLHCLPRARRADASAAAGRSSSGCASCPLTRSAFRHTCALRSSTICASALSACVSAESRPMGANGCRRRQFSPGFNPSDLESARRRLGPSKRYLEATSDRPFSAP